MSPLGIGPGTGQPLARMVASWVDLRLREGGDAGVPLVLSEPGSAAGQQLSSIAAGLVRGRGLAGRQLGLSPV